MGNYDSLSAITTDIKKFKALGMSDEEIDVILDEDGVEAGYRQSAFRRAQVS